MLQGAPELDAVEQPVVPQLENKNPKCLTFNTGWLNRRIDKGFNLFKGMIAGYELT